MQSGTVTEFGKMCDISTRYEMCVMLSTVYSYAQWPKTLTSGAKEIHFPVQLPQSKSGMKAASMWAHTQKHTHIHRGMYLFQGQFWGRFE